MQRGVRELFRTQLDETEFLRAVHVDVDHRRAVGDGLGENPRERAVENLADDVHGGDARGEVADVHLALFLIDDVAGSRGGIRSRAVKRLSRLRLGRLRLGLRVDELRGDELALLQGEHGGAHLIVEPGGRGTGVGAAAGGGGARAGAGARATATTRPRIVAVVIARARARSRAMPPAPRVPVPVAIVRARAVPDPVPVPFPVALAVLPPALLLLARATLGRILAQTLVAVPPALGVATTVFPVAVAIRISRLDVAAVAIVAPPRIRPGRVVHESARRRVPTMDFQSRVRRVGSSHVWGWKPGELDSNDEARPRDTARAGIYGGRGRAASGGASGG